MSSSRAILAPSLLDLAPATAHARLSAWVEENELPPFRLRQLIPRLWRRPVGSWGEASDLPAELRDRLDRDWPLPRLALATEQVSQDGTRKFLWRLADGEAIESVLIPSGTRRTLCISSQAGCALGCVFCATGRMGFRRNLTPFEIVGQVREILLRDPDLEAHQRGVHGHGGAAAQLAGGGRGAHHPQQPRWVRHRRETHHGVHGGNPPRHGAAGRAAGAVPAGHLAPLPERGTPPAAHADREEVRPRRGAGSGPGVSQADHLRVRPDRGSQRQRPGRRPAGGAGPEDRAPW